MSSGKIVLIFTFIFVYTLQGLAQTSSAEEKTLLDMERQRSEAILSHNMSFLNTLYHDQFRGVTTAGVIVFKKGMLELLKSTPKDILFRTEDINVSIYGYAGVTSGILISKNKTGSVLDQTRFMHVYIKRNGQWKIIEGQGTAFKE